MNLLKSSIILSCRNKYKEQYSKIFMVPVEQRNAATLLPIIEKIIFVNIKYNSKEI